MTRPCQARLEGQRREGGRKEGDQGPREVRPSPAPACLAGIVTLGRAGWKTFPFLLAANCLFFFIHITKNPPTDHHTTTTMLIYTDFLTGDEMLSDAYDV